MSLSEKRDGLFAAARAFVANEKDMTGGLALCKAASEYHEARMSAASGAAAAARQPETRDEVLLPFGRAKGKPLSKAGKGDLEWVLGALENSIEDASKARWRDSNIELRDAVKAELTRRG
jgi:hypothetical protein